MEYSVAALQNLIDQFARLPGIGKKSAQRLAFHIIDMSKEQAEDFCNSVKEAKEKIRYCSVCQNLTDSEVCTLCKDDGRDRSVICVVEEPKDVIALERTRQYNGLYHVLHGTISPMNGVTPADIKIKELLNRLKDDTVKEIIMATNASVEGEATAMYISHIVKPLGIKCTRLAYGLPVGGDLEYADEVTLTRAIEGRSEL